MTERKDAHTPWSEKWTLLPSGEIIDADGYSVCLVAQNKDYEDRAPLIASAPTLKAELEAMKHDIDRNFEISTELATENERLTTANTELAEALGTACQYVAIGVYESVQSENPNLEKRARKDMALIEAALASHRKAQEEII